jgi:hypothetical protein
MEISESDVKTTGESASIRRVMFSPMMFRYAKLILVGWIIVIIAASR